MSLDISELEPTHRNDYRRANGAPMVMVDGKSERFSRPSSFAKPLDDESALVAWKIDRAAIGVAYDRALQAAYVAVEQDDREAMRTLREKAISAGRGAERADIGTALHGMSVRWEKGEAGFSPPEPYFTSLTAYSNELRRLGLEAVRFEQPFVNVEHRCAGTADRVYETTRVLITPDGELLPIGTLLIGDLKTGDKLEYSKPAYAVQLALYAGGQYYDVITDDIVPTPPIDQRWGILVHMPADEPGRCEMLWCDLEVGRHGAWLVDQIKLWRKMWRNGEYALPFVEEWSDLRESFEGATVEHHIQGTLPAPPPGRAYDDWGNLGFVSETGLQNRVETVTTILDEPVDPDDAASPAGVAADDGLESWVEWIKLRLSFIACHESAKATLLYRWPTGLPTPKQGIENMSQVGIILKLLDTIEAEYQMGFVPKPEALQSSGPRSTHRKGK